MEAISEKGYSGHSNEGIIRFPVLAGYQVVIDKLGQQGVLSWDGLQTNGLLLDVVKRQCRNGYLVLLVLSSTRSIKLKPFFDMFMKG